MKKPMSVDDVVDNLWRDAAVHQEVLLTARGSTIDMKMPDKRKAQAKFALHQLMNEVIGGPEPFKPALTQAEHWGLTEGSVERVLDNTKAMGRNELRAQQHKALDKLFGGKAK